MRLNSHTRLGLGLALLLLASILLTVSVPAQERRQPPAVAWAPDGKILVAANGLLARFDLHSDQEELLDDSVITFALSPGGTRLAISGLQGLALRSYPDFERQAPLEPPLPDAGQTGPSRTASLLSLAWSPDGTTLAAGTANGHILLWDSETRELWADVGVEPASPVASLGFSADGRRLLSAFEDGRAVLWDIEEREVVQQFPAPRNAQGQLTAETPAMTLSPDGRSVLATRLRGEEAEIVLMDDKGRAVWQRSGYGVEFTSDGAALLALAPPFRIAALYRTTDAQALRTFEPPEGVRRLHALRLSPDGTRLLGVGETRTGQVLIVWDVATARVLKTRR